MVLASWPAQYKIAPLILRIKDQLRPSYRIKGEETKVSWTSFYCEWRKIVILRVVKAAEIVGAGVDIYCCCCNIE